MSEYRLAEKPALDALTAMGYAQLSPEAALSMRQEANRALLKSVLIEALQTLNEGLGADDAEAIYNDLSTLSDNEEWQRRLRGAYSRRLGGVRAERHHPDQLDPRVRAESGAGIRRRPRTGASEGALPWAGFLGAS